jgi:hypothetical protein
VKMIPVKSSNIAAVGYEDPAGTLWVLFKGHNDAHRYDDVPHAVFEKMRNAESIGSFFAKEIRGKYTHTPPKKREHE